MGIEEVDGNSCDDTDGLVTDPNDSLSSSSSSRYYIPLLLTHANKRIKKQAYSPLTPQSSFVQQQSNEWRPYIGASSIINESIQKRPTESKRGPQ